MRSYKNAAACLDDFGKVFRERKSDPDQARRYHYFVAMVVELNPVSPELAAEMRRWLSRPAGETLDSSSSFFGSFVSVFVNPKLGRADRVLRVRSQPFYRTPR